MSAAAAECAVKLAERSFAERIRMTRRPSLLAMHGATPNMRRGPQMAMRSRRVDEAHARSTAAGSRPRCHRPASHRPRAGHADVDCLVIYFPTFLRIAFECAGEETCQCPVVQRPRSGDAGGGKRRLVLAIHANAAARAASALRRIFSPSGWASPHRLCATRKVHMRRDRTAHVCRVRPHAHNSHMWR